MKLRFAVKDEAEQFLKWAARNVEKNHFDPAVLAYPLCTVAAAVNGKVVCYLPTHPVLMLDSVAPNPEATPRELYDGLHSLLEAAEKCAKMAGMGEVVFLASDPMVVRGAEHAGFSRSEMAVYRKRVL